MKEASPARTLDSSGTASAGRSHVRPPVSCDIVYEFSCFQRRVAHISGKPQAGHHSAQINGNDSPGVVTVDLAKLTGGFHNFTGDCCDSVSLSGVIRLQSIPGPLTGDPGLLETTTEVIRLGAYSDAMPEPSTLLLLGTGIAGLAVYARRRMSR